MLFINPSYVSYGPVQAGSCGETKEFKVTVKPNLIYQTDVTKEVLKVRRWLLVIVFLLTKGIAGR